MYSYDSRKIKEGDSFICLPGGEAYINEAKSKGAKEILKLSRTQMAELADAYYKQPSKSLKVIGITGTNGKTSVCHFLYQALRLLGKKPYIQGTLTHPLTTTESLDTQAAMRKHLDSGGDYFIMEVSSHGIHQQRVNNIDFDVKCLTNIYTDHLDYHKSNEHYKQTKLKFMKAGAAAAIYPSQILATPDIHNPAIASAHNQKNLKMAFLCLLALGFSDSDSRAVLGRIDNAPGRFEKVKNKAPFHVFIDYAHTEDALKAILEAANQIKSKGARVLCCFGCGGDRDKSKRPKMATVASELSDYIVLTQYNPRTEDPNSIMADIKAGLTHTPAHIEHDRYKAIQALLSEAKKDDVLIIAGKGHESSQVIGTTEHAFNDKKVAEDLLEKMGYK